MAGSFSIRKQETFQNIAFFAETSLVYSCFRGVESVSRVTLEAVGFLRSFTDKFLLAALRLTLFIELFYEFICYALECSEKQETDEAKLRDWSQLLLDSLIANLASIQVEICPALFSAVYILT